MNSLSETSYISESCRCSRRRKEILSAGGRPRWKLWWVLRFFKKNLNWRDLTILYISGCIHVHISSSLAILLSLLICCSQSRVPYYVNKGMRQMVPQSNEFIWGEGFNYGWVGPPVFWVQQTSQTLWDWQNPRCSFPGTFKNPIIFAGELKLGIELARY